MTEQPADIMIDRDEITIPLTIVQPELADGASDIGTANLIKDNQLTAQGITPSRLVSARVGEP